MSALGCGCRIHSAGLEEMGSNVTYGSECICPPHPHPHATSHMPQVTAGDGEESIQGICPLAFWITLENSTVLTKPFCSLFGLSVHLALGFSLVLFSFPFLSASKKGLCPWPAYCAFCVSGPKGAGKSIVDQRGVLIWWGSDGEMQTGGAKKSHLPFPRGDF